MSATMEGARLNTLEDHLSKALAVLKTAKEENEKRKVQEEHDRREAAIKETIRLEVEQQQRVHLAQAAKNQPNEELRNEMRAQVVNDLKEELRDQLAEEVYSENHEAIAELVRDKIRADLTKKLAPKIEAELRPGIEQQLRKEVYAKLEEEIKARIAALDDAAGRAPAAKQATEDPLPDHEDREYEFALRADEASLSEYPESLPDYEDFDRAAPPSSPPLLIHTDEDTLIPSIELPSPRPRTHPAALAFSAKMWDEASGDALAPPSPITDDDDDEHWEQRSAASVHLYDRARQYGRAASPDDDHLRGSCRENAITLDSGSESSSYYEDEDEELVRGAAAGRKRARSGEEEEGEEGGWKRRRVGCGRRDEEEEEGRWEEEFAAEETLVERASPREERGWYGPE